ncbi:MAG: glycosyltransferase [Proteobacteria bacterium]|nr:glycosyltransferase [Pseudomonadota bacterium]
MRATRMRITVVDSDLPYPTNSGKRLRSLNLVLPLAKRHQITYIARAGDAGEARVAREFLGDHGFLPVIVDAPLPQKSGPGFALSLASNLISPLPYSAVLHASARMRAAVSEHARTTAIDVMQLEHVNYMYCHDGLGCPVVVQAHNVESLIWKRLAATAGNPLKKSYFGLQERRYAAFERQAYHTADCVIACSEADAELARKLYGAPRVTVVDNGVDIGYFADVAPDPEARRILFLGALDWRPNIDAVEVLLSRIFPEVRAKVPDATLAIVGRKPGAHLARLVEGVPGASLHGDVPDVRAYMREAAVMAVPLRVGGGSRLKILESLAASLPVVSTTVGAEGLELEAGHDLTIADEPEAMAAALAEALVAPAGLSAQAASGRARVAARYDWPMLAQRLEQVWETALRQRTLAA